MLHPPFVREPPITSPSSYRWSILRLDQHDSLRHGRVDFDVQERVLPLPFLVLVHVRADARVSAGATRKELHLRPKRFRLRPHYYSFSTDHTYLNAHHRALLAAFSG